MGGTFDGVPADDLRFIANEAFTTEEGERLACVYSLSLDAVTFVSADEEAQLRARGVIEIAELPTERQP